MRGGRSAPCASKTNAGPVSPIELAWKPPTNAAPRTALASTCAG